MVKLGYLLSAGPNMKPHQLTEAKVLVDSFLKRGVCASLGQSETWEVRRNVR